jgi:hypothetical protein
VPAPDPTAYRHDGFYLRLGLGVGWMRGEVESLAGEVKIRGVGPAFELALGGTVAPGLVIGGGIYTVGTETVKWESDLVAAWNEDGESTIEGGQGALGMLGVIIDFYPNPRGGFHVQGGLGIGTLTLERDPDTDFPGENWEGGGGGAMLGAGYEFFVGEQWSIGGVARVVFVSGKLRGSETERDNDGRGFAPAILFGATHH